MTRHNATNCAAEYSAPYFIVGESTREKLDRFKREQARRNARYEAERRQEALVRLKTRLDRKRFPYRILDGLMVHELFTISVAYVVLLIYVCLKQALSAS